MKKFALYKKNKIENDLTKGERVTISEKNGCTVTTYIDFKRSGLVILSRENMAFWGFWRVVNAYLSRGYEIIKKGV